MHVASASPGHLLVNPEYLISHKDPMEAHRISSWNSNSSRELDLMAPSTSALLSPEISQADIPEPSMLAGIIAGICAARLGAPLEEFATLIQGCTEKDVNILITL